MRKTTPLSVKMREWESNFLQLFIKIHQSRLIGAQSKPINPGWGRKGSPGTGRTSSPGARDGQQGSFPGWHMALGTAGEQAKPCPCPPPSLPGTQGARSAPGRNVPCPLCLKEGAGCQRSAQHLGLWLSASATFKAASQAWVAPGEITRFVHSRERQWSAVEANEGEEAATQNKVTHFWTCYALKTSPEFTDSGFTHQLK